MLLLDCGVILLYKGKRTRKIYISECITQQIVVLHLSVPVERQKSEYFKANNKTLIR